MSSGDEDHTKEKKDKLAAPGTSAKILPTATVSKTSTKTKPVKKISSSYQHHRTPPQHVHIPKPTELAIFKQLQEKRERLSLRQDSNASNRTTNTNDLPVQNAADGLPANNTEDDGDAMDSPSNPGSLIGADAAIIPGMNRQNLYCNTRRTTLVMILCGFIFIILAFIIIIGHWYTPHVNQSPSGKEH